MSKATYPLKLPLSIKKAAQRLAKEDGVSLNQWIAAAVAEKVGVVETAADFFKKRARKAAGELPDTVVVQLGNNGTFTDRQADALLDVLSGVRRVVLVNLRVPRAWEGPNNAVIAAAASYGSPVAAFEQRRAGRLAHGRHRPPRAAVHRLHLRPQGAEEFASLIAAAL